MTQDKKFKQRVRAWAREHNVSYSTALRHFRQTEQQPDPDQVLLQGLERRWKETGSVQDEAAYLGARLRLGRLTQEQLVVAAALGHPAASLATTDGEEIPVLAVRERGWLERQRLRAGHLVGIRRTSLAQSLLLDWIRSLGPLGPRALAEAGRVAVRSQGRDWAQTHDLLDRLWRIEGASDLEEAVDSLCELVFEVSRTLRPEDLKAKLETGLVAWGVGASPAGASSVPRAFPDDEADDPVTQAKVSGGKKLAKQYGDPIRKLSHRLLEDAISRCSTKISLEVLEGTARVRYEEEERMQFPLRALPTLEARYRFMAGLDLLTLGEKRTGAFTYRDHTREYRIDARFSGQQDHGEVCCLTLKQIAGPAPAPPLPPRTPTPGEQRWEEEQRAAEEEYDRCLERLRDEDLDRSQRRAVRADLDRVEAKLDALEARFDQEVGQVLEGAKGRQDPGTEAAET